MRRVLAVLFGLAALALAPSAQAASTGEAGSTLPNVGIAAGASLQTWSKENLERQLNDYVAMHAHWIRHDFAQDVIEPQSGKFNFTGYDQLVQLARERDINVIATITYTAAWNNGGHGGGEAGHKYEPEGPEGRRSWSVYAANIAGHFAPMGVHTYEIWNEPNIGFWAPKPNTQTYTELLCETYIRIHRRDPQATVLTGGTSPAGTGSSTISPQDFLKGIYSAGGKSCFDGVSMHPYVDGSTPGPTGLGNAWELMGEHKTTLREIMEANGDGAKKIYATESGCNRSRSTDAQCSEKLKKAFALWKTYPWAGVYCWFTYWDPNSYGLVDGAWKPRPEWYAYQTAAAAYP
jgi:hypothetical protein